MTSAKSNVSVRIGCADYFCEVEFDVSPGVPEVRYYSDGSGYPGSPDEVDCINCVRLIESERAIDGNYDNDDPENWEYFDRNDYLNSPEGVGGIEQRLIAELSSGAYDYELLEDSDYVEA